MTGNIGGALKLVKKRSSVQSAKFKSSNLLHDVINWTVAQLCWFNVRAQVVQNI